MCKKSSSVTKHLEIGYVDDISQIQYGGVVMEKPVYKSLDIRKIKDKKSVVVSTEEALKDVIPIEWDTEVVNGNKHVVLVDKS